MSANIDYYSILEVSTTASSEEIKKSFHRLAFQFHPDHNPNNPKATEEFRRLNEAYQVLSNTAERSKYDRSKGDFTRITPIKIVPYLRVEVDTHSVKLNEEVELTFVFSSEGRNFIKEPVRDWFFSSGPWVEHKDVYEQGVMMRQTRMRYTICPIKTGRLYTPKAQIKYENVLITSDAFEINVGKNHCYFNAESEAGNDPVVVDLYKEIISINARFKKTVIQRRKVLVPRSTLAAWYHKVGKSIKLICTFCGISIALLNDQNFILGGLMGSLFAGINIQVMYKLVSVKSIWYHQSKYPLVQEYYTAGFRLGDQPEELFPKANWKVFLKRMFY